MHIGFLVGTIIATALIILGSIAIVLAKKNSKRSKWAIWAIFIGIIALISAVINYNLSDY